MYHFCDNSIIHTYCPLCRRQLQASAPVLESTPVECVSVSKGMLVMLVNVTAQMKCQLALASSKCISVLKLTGASSVLLL